MLPKTSSAARWLSCVVVLAVVLGVLFRIEHAQRRLFWQDETFTALRVSGHTDPEFRSLFDGRVHALAAVAKFQRVDPTRGVGATVSGLAAEEPQHPPVFYVLDHLWATVFGSSIPSLRALPVIFSLLAVFAAAWLAFELSGSWIVAGCAAALMAVSPFFVDYAGQAREYSLWSLCILVASALLLRALRSHEASDWCWYGISMTVGLYSDLLMVCVLASHAAYVALRYRRDFAALGGFAVAAAASVVIFLPWAVICYLGRHQMEVQTQWALAPYAPRLMLEKWLFNTASVLFDAEYASMILAPVAGILLLLLIYGAFRMFRSERRSVALFLLTLGAVIVVEQVATDVVTHGHQSTTARYLIPLWTAFLVSSSLLFGRLIADESGAVRKGWFAAFCAVLMCATASSAINSSATVWWDNNDNYPSTSIAKDINASSTPPLVVSEGHWTEVLVMSHYLEPQARFLLFKTQPPFPLPIAQDAFLLAPSAATLRAFRAQPGYAVVPVPVAPLESAAILSFHKAVQKSEKDVVASDRAKWQSTFLFRLESRVASI